MVHVGLVHLPEELPRVGGEALDVAPLALGVDGVESQGRLAAPRGRSRPPSRPAAGRRLCSSGCARAPRARRSTLVLGDLYSPLFSRSRVWASIRPPLGRPRVYRECGHILPPRRGRFPSRATLILVLEQNYLLEPHSRRGAVGGHLNPEPEHLVDVVTLLGT